MTRLRVRDPGALTTVQDLGRPGHAAEGVSASGAADPLSLRLGNRLVGNAPGAAALEMTLRGGSFVLDAPGLVALTGSDFGAEVLGPRPRAVARFAPVALEPGETLSVGATRSGARAYLSIRGGIEVPEVLGSRSTHLLCGLGGLEGRALRLGDVLPLGEKPAAAPAQLLVDAREIDAILFRRVLRVTRGPESDWFSADSLVRLGTSDYEVTEEADRMGLRLRGGALARVDARPMLTEGVCLGTIQVPESGQPILLFVEQRTTGGYPRIASVALVDLPALGQLRPRDRVRFHRIEIGDAHALLRAQEDFLTGAVGPS